MFYKIKKTDHKRLLWLFLILIFGFIAVADADEHLGGQQQRQSLSMSSFLHTNGTRTHGSCLSNQPIHSNYTITTNMNYEGKLHRGSSQG